MRKCSQELFLLSRDPRATTGRKLYVLHTGQNKCSLSPLTSKSYRCLLFIKLLTYQHFISTFVFFLIFFLLLYFSTFLSIFRKTRQKPKLEKTKRKKEKQIQDGKRKHGKTKKQEETKNKKKLIRCRIMAFYITVVNYQFI